jgi:hypothetical protein
LTESFNRSPKWIKSLSENEIFVFGSNLVGFRAVVHTAVDVSDGDYSGVDAIISGVTFVNKPELATPDPAALLK